MNSSCRVNICYRPIRVGWVVESGDFNSLRQAIKLSHTLWGGGFNPILPLNDDNQVSNQLADLFRVDMLCPIGNVDATTFLEKFSHLKSRSFHDLVLDPQSKHSNLLDVYSALIHMQNSARTTKDKNFTLHHREQEDPLSDVFLAQFGDYPDRAMTAVDYKNMIDQVFSIESCNISTTSPIPANVLDHPNISMLSRYLLKRYQSFPGTIDKAGFFVGDSSNFDDIVCFWNLRAADIPLLFIDPNHQERYSNLVSAWNEKILKIPAKPYSLDKRAMVYGRPENLEKTSSFNNSMNFVHYHISDFTWNGLNVLPPTMIIDETSVMGIVEKQNEKIGISFPLSNNPISKNSNYSNQHLIASIKVSGTLNKDCIFNPPYIPELNKFYNTEMRLNIGELRIEPNHIGIIIRSSDTDEWINSIHISSLIETIFNMAGYKTELSNAGRLTKQIITNLGGLQNTRVFKVPGVRRILREKEVTLEKAKNLIRSQDQESVEDKFKENYGFYIAPPSQNGRFEPKDAFEFLVEKNLFRIGVNLNCTACQLESWIHVDNIKQITICELCGHKYNTSRQLMNSKYTYKRSGILNIQKDHQGSIPVILTLQQLDANLGSPINQNFYYPSINLTLKGEKKNECEIDFIWIEQRQLPQKTIIILGECKDQKEIEPKDVDKIRKSADFINKNYFDIFILLSTLKGSYTDEEIALIKGIKEDGHRIILLTRKELDSYHMYEDFPSYNATVEGMASHTETTYFASNLQ